MHTTAATHRVGQVQPAEEPATNHDCMEGWRHGGTSAWELQNRLQHKLVVYEFVMVMTVNGHTSKDALDTNAHGVAEVGCRDDRHRNGCKLRQGSRISGQL